MKKVLRRAVLGGFMCLPLLGAAETSAAFSLHYSAEDGQAVSIKGNVETDDTTAALGDKSFRFGSGYMNIIELPGSKNLKEQFTLAAFIKGSSQTKNMRLFSNYPGAGKVAPDVLLVDLLMAGGEIDLRLYVAGQAISQPLPVTRLDDGWHHVAVVFDQGRYTLYFDGRKLLQSKINVDSLALAEDLRFGEDLGGKGNEQFSGYADQIMLLATAMSDQDIAALAQKGVNLQERKMAEALVKTETNETGQQVEQMRSHVLIDFSNKADVEALSEAALAQVSTHADANRVHFVDMLADVKNRSEVTTKTFSINGGEQLFLNLDAAKGFVLVEVLDASGKPVPGYEKANAMALVYDTPDQVVKWNSHASLPNTPMEIKLKITGQKTKLYAVALCKTESNKPIHNPGLARQLFADYWLVDNLEGEARLDVKKPVDRGVVMTLDKPWEGNTSAYATFLHDEAAGKYRLYFRGLNHEGRKATHDATTCYAESEDGIHWTRPNLNKFEFEGSKDNNIVLDVTRTPNAINGSFTPFIDTNPDARESERFKAIGGESKFASFLYSPNGVDWETYPQTAFQYPLDSQQTLFWHPLEKQYRVYLRAWYYGRGYNGVRGIKTATSKDLVNWSNAEWLVYPDAPREQLYTNNIRVYERAPQLTIGFPSRLVRGSNVDPQFMVSRDGVTFHRWGETIITAGQNPDKWGGRCNYLWYGLVETASEFSGVKELSVYSHERYYRGEGVQLRRHTYRLDGFVSVYAPQSGGAVTTKPLKAAGTKLAVNYSTSAGGEMVVHVLDGNGHTLVSSPVIFGDEVDAIIPLSIPASQIGKSVRLKFTLKDAEVFAFRFVEE